MVTKVGRVKDLFWKVKQLEPRGLSQLQTMDSVGQYQGSHLTWLSGTWYVHPSYLHRIEQGLMFFFLPLW